jgi:hypothetical protein
LKQDFPLGELLPAPIGRLYGECMVGSVFGGDDPPSRVIGYQGSHFEAEPPNSFSGPFTIKRRLALVLRGLGVSIGGDHAFSG